MTNTVYFQAEDGIRDAQESRGLGDVYKRQAQGWAEGFLRDYADDIPVWEHKVFRATPALAEVDGPFARYRRWYAQFYA